jgi:hypothetical protein
VHTDFAPLSLITLFGHVDSTTNAPWRETKMAPCTVRFGDTLWAIAERCYGDGHFWLYLADHNSLAEAGVLYEGQRLEAPPLPGRLRSLADAHRPALPLGHAPVRIRLDGSEPLVRYDASGVFGLSGLVGELIFHRHGPVHLGELTASRLLEYRCEQLAWAQGVFVAHVCTAGVARCDFTQPSTGPNVPQNPYQSGGPGYTITGRIGVWQVINVHRGIIDGPTNLRVSLAMNPSALFDSATLVLGDLPAPPDAPPERLVPFGCVLRAACPHLISPAALRVLTSDEAFFPGPQPTPTMPEQEEGRTAPRATPLSAPQRKKSARKVGRNKPHIKKRATRQVKPQTSREGVTNA